MPNVSRAIRRRSEPESILSTGLKGLAGFTLAAAASWIVYSRLAIDHKMVLPEALPSVRKTYDSPRAGTVSYYMNDITEGRPIVLIHSINAAASAYEMRPLFMQYITRRPVFALELPGFGFSNRSKRIYSPELYEGAITDFMEGIVGQAADVVALSLGSEFAARAALAHPQFFNSLTLISPTGFNSGKQARGSQQASRAGTSDLFHDLFSFPVWARPFYDLITTHQSIVYFLKQSFVGAVPEDLVTYDYATAHQPNAENAPLYFISGKLFTPDIRTTVYDQLKVPVLVIYDRDNFTNFDLLPETLSNNAFWQAVRLVPTLGLPHFERPEDTTEVLDKFWK